MADGAARYECGFYQKLSILAFLTKFWPKTESQSEVDNDSAFIVDGWDRIFALK